MKESDLWLDLGEVKVLEVEPVDHQEGEQVGHLSYQAQHRKSTKLLNKKGQYNTTLQIPIYISIWDPVHVYPDQDPSNRKSQVSP